MPKVLTGASASTNSVMRSGFIPPLNHDLDVPEAGQVEPRTHLLDEVGSGAAPGRRSVDPNPTQLFTKGARDGEGLLALVPERVDQGNSRHLLRHVLVERLHRLDGTP